MKNKHINKLFLALLSSTIISSTFSNDVLAENITTNKNVEVVAIENNNNSIVNVEKFVLTEEDYKTKSAVELAELVKAKKVTSEELVKTAFEIIKKENPNLNAVIATREEEALKEAKALDLLSDEEKTAPFFGVPTLLKGLGHTIKDLPATNGFTYDKDKIAKTDSSVAKNFRELGFVLLGLTNYPEYGMRNITDSKLYGAAKNPLNIEYNAGGSSGGSAAAVASGMVPLASGSDIGGSIRIPAAWTGTIGLKPTSNSYLGTFPIVKNSKDLETFFMAINQKNKNLVDIKDIKTLKIGYSLDNFDGIEVSDASKKATLEAVEFLKKQGFTVEEVTYPLNPNYMLEQYTRVNAPNFSGLEKKLEKANLTKYDVDPLTWAFYVYNRDLDKTDKSASVAKKELEKQIAILENFHKTYPLLLTPTNAQLAPKNTDYYVTKEMEETLYNFENVPKEKRYEILVKQWEPMFRRTPFTLMYNLTKEPAISLPTYIGENNLAMGIMLNAPKNYDKVLIEFAKLFENNNMFKMNLAITKSIDKKGSSLINDENKKIAIIKEEEIPFVEEKIEDNTLDVGVSKVISNGKNGKRVIVEENGNIIANTILEEAEDKIILIGTKKPSKEIKLRENKDSKENKDENKLKILPNTGEKNNNLLLTASTLLILSILSFRKLKKK